MCKNKKALTIAAIAAGAVGVVAAGVAIGLHIFKKSCSKICIAIADEDFITEDGAELEVEVEYDCDCGCGCNCGCECHEKTCDCGENCGEDGECECHKK